MADGRVYKTLSLAAAPLAVQMYSSGRGVWRLLSRSCFVMPRVGSIGEILLGFSTCVSGRSCADAAAPEPSAAASAIENTTLPQRIMCLNPILFRNRVILIPNATPHTQSADHIHSASRKWNTPAVER